MILLFFSSSSSSSSAFVVMQNYYKCNSSPASIDCVAIYVWHLHFDVLQFCHLYQMVAEARPVDHRNLVPLAHQTF